MRDTSLGYCSYTANTYYFWPGAPWAFTSCYVPEPKPTKGERAARWWKYITGFAPTRQEVLSWIIPIARNAQRLRIHHERQYPRIIKYRNNRMP